MVIGKETVVDPLNSGALLESREPGRRASWDRGKQTQIRSVAKINDFTVGSFVAIGGKRAVADLAGNHGTAILSAVFGFFKAPVEHFVAVSADRDASRGKSQALDLWSVIGTAIERDDRRDTPMTA